MNAYGTGQYRQAQVTTVDKGRLVVLLYEGAIKFLREAVQAQALGDIPSKSNNVNRALDIISELSQSLNMQDGGEIAINLKQLYTFWTEHLLKGKVSRNSQAIEDVVEMMCNMAEAWQIICSDVEASKLTKSVDGVQPRASLTATRTV